MVMWPDTIYLHNLQTKDVCPQNIFVWEECLETVSIKAQAMDKLPVEKWEIAGAGYRNIIENGSHITTKEENKDVDHGSCWDNHKSREDP